MNKKTVTICIFVIVLILTVFCGCRKTDEAHTTGTDATQTSSQEVTETFVATEPSTTQEATVADGEQYTPAHRDDNETEILTLPPADSQEPADSQKATVPLTEPDLNDYIPSGTAIELPFVPIY